MYFVGLPWTFSPTLNLSKLYNQFLIYNSLNHYLCSIGMEKPTPSYIQSTLVFLRKKDYLYFRIGLVFNSVIFLSNSADLSSTVNPKKIQWFKYLILNLSATQYVREGVKNYFLLTCQQTSDILANLCDIVKKVGIIRGCCWPILEVFWHLNKTPTFFTLFEKL